MTEEEFSKKLKELCLKYDLYNGESYEATYAGCEIYGFYCEENGLESNYLGELYKLEECEQKEEHPKEYYISGEELKLGDIVCDGNSTIPLGFVTGILESGIVIDGGIGFALGSGRIVVDKNELKKLGIREIVKKSIEDSK